MRKLYIIPSTCVACGAEVPEGRMVCPVCAGETEMRNESGLISPSASEQSQAQTND